MKEKAKTKKMDMLHGPIWSKLPRYAIPVAATGILEQLFNATDIAVVGNFTGKNSTVSVAAVGANSPIIGLILNLFIGIALGANVVIANTVGRNDKKTIHKAVQTSIMMALIGGILVTIIGELGIAQLLRMLHVPQDVFPYALSYIRIYLIGMPAILLYNFESAIFRSIGDTKVPLEALAISGVLNVVLNLFFVIVLKMNVNGVAIATVIANVVSSILLFIKLLKTDKVIHIEMNNLKIDKESFKKIIKIGLPAGIQSAVFAAANIVIQSAINSLGTNVIAASSAAFNIEILAYYVLNSFSQACATFVGQNYGAGYMKRCRKTLILCLVEDAIASASAIIIVLLVGKSLLALFNNNPQVIEIGYTRLIMIFSAYTFSMLYELMSGYLRGFGISLVPAILTIIGVCGVRIVWIYTVFPMKRTFKTIMMAYPISLSITAVLIFIALLIYRPSHKLSVDLAEK
ncbi:MATE family efflux transporter [Clostridium sp. MSJ-8]|uniref:MATE family efflux transporter n=1 Tax=Clostridium sp. MSJ-8 TaxID=2841510 RepID=UPI001C0EFE55|nr:MATE family efflux transporter [Clostridium sp. MSJ-8]MBU5488841.1 MATE family efflux transporter [Clostridium sp. MSJ-8]